MEQKRDYRAEIQAVKTQYMLGAISHDEAKRRVEPILEEMNATMKRICAENKMKFKPLTFAYVFR